MLININTWSWGRNWYMSIGTKGKKFKRSILFINWYYSFAHKADILLNENILLYTKLLITKLEYLDKYVKQTIQKNLYIVHEWWSALRILYSKLLWNIFSFIDKIRDAPILRWKSTASFKYSLKDCQPCFEFVGVFPLFFIKYHITVATLFW